MIQSNKAVIYGMKATKLNQTLCIAVFKVQQTNALEPDTAFTEQAHRSET